MSPQRRKKNEPVRYRPHRTRRDRTNEIDLATLEDETTTEAAAEHFIDGQFRRAERTETVIEAATETSIGEGPSATHGDIDDAVAAARRALDGWKRTPVATRAAVLERLAHTLESNGEQTAALCTRETGSPIATSRLLNSVTPAAMFRYYAGITPNVEVEEVRPGAFGHTVVRKEPVGVVCAIVPWNAPRALAAWKVAPGLAAGCSVA